MTYSERAELIGMIARHFEVMGGVSTLPELRDSVAPQVPAPLVDYLVRQGLSSLVREYFRSTTSDGLPVAPEVDEHGTHMLIELGSVEEYRYMVRKYMERSTQNRRKAVLLAQRCFEMYGVNIDVDNPDSHTTKAAS